MKFQQCHFPIPHPPHLWHNASIRNWEPEVVSCWGVGPAHPQNPAPTESTKPSALLVWWRKLWCANGDVLWGHLCGPDEGCYRSRRITTNGGKPGGNLAGL